MEKCLCIFVLILILQGARATNAQQQADATPQDFVALAKTFVDLLAREDFARAVEGYDATMKTALPQEKLRDTWKTLITQAGAYKRQVSISVKAHDQYQIVTLTCDFEKSALNVKVVFNQARQVAGLFFEPVPPEYSAPRYVNPSTFSEQELMIGKGEWALTGTLTIPKSESPLPAVVLVHGSGPHDRDESIGPNKPFRDLAWGLATHGIAVLRYEKRTMQHRAKFSALKQFTVKEETIDDVLAAVEVLRTQPTIARDRIFVLGHSLGGSIVPRVGKLDPGSAGFIVMAGSVTPIEDIMLDQFKYIFSIDGSISKEEQEQIAGLERQIASIKSLKASDKDSPVFILGVPAAYWLDLRGYNPPMMAKSLKQPMFILQGERDYQVTMDEFQKWKAALISTKNVSFKSYPNLNHLFMEGSGKSVPAEYGLEGHVAEPVIVDIANWIKNTNAKR